jgi:RHS repeat-associated protein
VLPVAPQPLPLAASVRPGSASGKATSPQKNRVWVFSRRPSGRRRAKRPQVAGVASGCRACDYKTVSGLGFWLNRDPIGEGGGVNLYAYCEDNPLSRIDPYGKNWFTNVINGIWEGITQVLDPTPPFIPDPQVTTAAGLIVACGLARNNHLQCTIDATIDLCLNCDSLAEEARRICAAAAAAAS